MENQIDVARNALAMFIEANLPVNYERGEADSNWHVGITNEGKLELGVYAEHIDIEHWKELPLTKLAYLAESVS